MAEKALDDYWKHEEDKPTAMRDFRKTLEDFAKKSPLIIVIDELDRCRPDYALSVLEIIKHFFSLPGIHFVFGVNLEALENSVRCRYGPGIDAHGYLN